MLFKEYQIKKGEWINSIQCTMAKQGIFWHLTAFTYFSCLKMTLLALFIKLQMLTSTFGKYK